MIKLSNTKRQDLEDLKFMRQMIIEANKELRYNYITKKEYDYILSRTLANVELLEVKYVL